MSMSFHRITRSFITRFIKPIIVIYLSRQRNYRYANIKAVIYRGVFHPGFFFSTKALINFLETMELKDKNLLELGCGSGLISIVAARNGANVTASDINPATIECAQLNGQKNGVKSGLYFLIFLMH